MTYYQILGVKPNASVNEIRRAFLQQLKTWHPDVNKAPEALQMTRLIIEAWEILKDPLLKRIYDDYIASKASYREEPIWISTIRRRAEEYANSPLDKLWSVLKITDVALPGKIMGYFYMLIAGVLAIVTIVIGITAVVAALKAKPSIIPQRQNYKAWWYMEYPSLVKKTTLAKDSNISTKYFNELGIIGVSLYKKYPEGIILKLIPPRKAFDQNAIYQPDSIIIGISRRKKPILSIRDNDEDGFPDDFNIYLTDGDIYTYNTEWKDSTKYIQYKNNADYDFILTIWNTNIGYLINFFLHGVGSTLPTKISANIIKDKKRDSIIQYNKKVVNYDSIDPLGLFK